MSGKKNGGFGTESFRPDQITNYAQRPLNNPKGSDKPVKIGKGSAVNKPDKPKSGDRTK